MNFQPDVDIYFNRIAYKGPRDATLETLRALHKLHTHTISFENLNPLLGIPVKLDPEALQKKLIHGNRGGYCFEQNLLFKQILKILGFRVKGLAARIRWNVPEGRITPRGHMLLLVTIDGNNYIADVGFGGLTLTTPLLLEPDKVQQTTHEPYRLLRNGSDFVLQSLIRDEWKSLYQFDLSEQFLPDYEVTNWYLSNHPESHFVTGLIAARPDQDLRYALRNNELSIHHLKGSTERKTLKSAAQLREVLEQLFHLKLPETDTLNSMLERLVRQEETAS